MGAPVIHQAGIPAGQEGHSVDQTCVAQRHIDHVVKRTSASAVLARSTVSRGRLTCAANRRAALPG